MSMRSNYIAGTARAKSEVPGGTVSVMRFHLKIISSLTNQYPFGHEHLFSLMRDGYFCPGRSVCS